MKHYSCPNCSSRLSFEALSCWRCKGELGYVFSNDSMVSLRNLPVAARCINREVLSCNWIVDPAIADVSTLCPGCRYTRTIPPQQDDNNRAAWKKLEQAKRLLLYSLRSLGLSPPDRVRQPADGLAFDFLTEFPDQSSVLTAHKAGVITINISEADDTRREQYRTSLREPYRTVLGHLRHEVGHFYWDQLIAHSDLLERYRLYFGDERQDYEAALQNYYGSKDINDEWRHTHISRYASAHPWEDWAETWAYYLNIHDVLDTAAAWKVTVPDANMALQTVTPVTDQSFYRQIRSVWPQYCEYLNAILHSSGVNDEYPSHLSETVVRKLTFVHQVVIESEYATQDVEMASAMS